MRRRVRVQPGVVRNELNLELARHGLFFGPETSTANRAMIGGMVGNNSCGSNSTSMAADTALRDIKDLLERGILVRESAGGRSTSYRLASSL